MTDAETFTDEELTLFDIVLDMYAEQKRRLGHVAYELRALELCKKVNRIRQNRLQEFESVG